MALIVEDGTGLSTAESYISVPAFKAYADARGLDYGASTDAQIEQALRRATAWLDAVYGARFGGYRVAVSQALVFPRSGLVDREGFGIAYNSVPRQIASATAEAAVREIATPGSLSPDVVPGEMVKSLKAGSAQIDYAGAGNAVLSATPVVQIIDGILSTILGRRSAYTAHAVRG
ncbi:MAG: DnaT-like ssDNA-binding protein [Pseudolysinimonas sp.]